MNRLLKASTILALLSPLMAFGQVTPSRSITNGDINWAPTGGTDALSRFLSRLSTWITYLVVIVIAIAMLVFLWGIVQYITAGADEEKRAGARNYMIYGIIGLFVMVSVWGLVYFLGSMIGIHPGGGLGANEMPGVPGISVGGGAGGS